MQPELTLSRHPRQPAHREPPGNYYIGKPSHPVKGPAMNLATAADAGDPAQLLAKLRERVARATESRPRISEADLWQTHGAAVWKAEAFVGTPTFYPVYRSGSHYSYSVLSLILAKGYLAVNPPVLAEAGRDGYVHSLSEKTIDAEIHRIGGPVRTRPTISEGADYARLIAAAVTEDVAACERRHPGFTNVILCGGKDSLNLTLLPWTNATVIASAPPNYELVVRFVRDNGLEIPVIRLDDRADPDVLRREVLANACRNDLARCRWGVDLRSLARELGHQVVFWKGQLFDLTSTPKWKSYTHPAERPPPQVRRVYHDWVAWRLPRIVQRFASLYWLYPAFRRSLWRRGAMWQGAHMSIMREVTDSLVLSAYHGPAATRTLGQVDLWTAAARDIRPAMGLALHGQPVTYPADNPRPPLSKHRSGFHRPEHFLTLLRAGGVRIVG